MSSSRLGTSHSRDHVGITVAAIVTGNAVLLKQTSSTPVIAYKFIEVLEEAGLPTGGVNFVPGSGSEIGDYLVVHPNTRFISFTSWNFTSIDVLP